jgi:hypothetical protein
MASDGARVFVLGGMLNETHKGNTFHVLDTSPYSPFCQFIRTVSKFENGEHIKYPNSDPNAVKPSEKTTQLVRKSHSSPLTQEQQYQTSSSSEAYTAHGASPFKKAITEDLGSLASLQITRE